MKKFTNSLFIFRRDYRIYDNYGLNECCKNSSNVYPIFIFSPDQIDDKKNIYKSNNAVQFLVESIEDLQEQIQDKHGILGIYYGQNIKVLKKIIKEKDIDSIYVCEDYTPYSIERDKQIKDFCLDNDIIFNSIEDIMLYPKNKVLSNDQKPYTTFTHYKNKAKELFNIPKPQNLKNNEYKFSKQRIITKHIIDKTKMNSFYNKNNNIKVNGGRKLALDIFKNVVPKMKQYNKKRDIPSEGNTFLSAYIRFGCVSLRECYECFIKELGKNNDIIDQLYWFCFYTELGINFPDMYKERSLIDDLKNIKWSQNKTHFEAWIKGRTGYPLSDAGMREMNETGFMHNRVRMVSATLLSRILLLDWRLGEKYFSKMLIDHLRSNNDGNWFWVVGTAPHSQVYFRIMSEESQIKRFDKECTYIKKWIPELKDVPPKDILNWSTKYKNYDIDYPKPIVDYKTNRQESLNRYKQSKESFK